MKSTRELTASFGGARLLAPHRLPDDLLISRAVANVALDLARDPGQTNPAHAFIARVHEKATNLLTATPAIKKLDKELQIIKALKDWPPKLLAFSKGSELLHTICLMTNGRCDLSCVQCYTDQMASPQAPLEFYQIALREAANNGARVVYIAGEGEPFLDDHIGDIIEIAAIQKMDVLMFSNGLLFCHETSPYRRLRAKIMLRDDEVDIPTFVHWLAEKPVHLYLKMHSANRTTNSRLCGMLGKPLDYTYKRVTWGGQQVDIPTPLLRLPECGFPTEQLGFDMMVIRENAEELVKVIGPWSQSIGLALYAESFIPSGRILGNPAPTEEQLKDLRQAGYLVRQDCTLNKILGKIVVWSRGYISPILAFTWRQLEGRPSLKYPNNPSPEAWHPGFMPIRSDHPLFINMRYQAGCPCAMGNQSLAKLLNQYAPRKNK